MILILLPVLALIAAIVFRFQRGAGRRWSVHVVAISAALLVMALARAASSHNPSHCALDLAPPAGEPMAKIHR
jgi:hypothetical protein